MSLKTLFTAAIQTSRRSLNQKTWANSFHTSSIVRKAEDRKEMLASMPAKDEGTAGEKSIDIDTLLGKKEKFFPDAGLNNQLFNGLPFSDIPIANIRVSPNNTIIVFTDSKGVPRLTHSCGVEGFKNARKGTNIAAQATAITVGSKALELGWKTIRVKVKGLGPGRMSAIKGLQMSGLNIISITDNTPVSWNPPRARKQRSL
ncbi:small ribosomal subunit protein uS11m [Stomoxys calcitrans]|uniref:small ribosomal subunit protein uS11m n=1 Tax=Stomoxys calcitrans TaxID=35570 RepID=UPI0027E2CD12|nr:small ribosomal subunit protein uS11m [Stomoxys calcitrans]